MTINGKNHPHNNPFSRPVQPLHDEMHRDHQRWTKELETWRADVVEWQQELNSVLDGVAEFQKALEEKYDALYRESELIKNYQQTISNHEKVMAQFENGGTSDQVIVAARDHYEQSSRHDELKKAHETTRRGHRSIVSAWEQMRKAISESHPQ